MRISRELAREGMARYSRLMPDSGASQEGKIRDDRPHCAAPEHRFARIASGYRKPPKIHCPRNANQNVVEESLNGEGHKASVKVDGQPLEIELKKV